MANVFLAKINRMTLALLDFGSPANTARFHEWTKTHNGEEVRISLITKTRSVNQNNLYWMYLDLIEKETGNEANDLHEFFKRKFLPPAQKTILGNTIKLPGSTTELDKTAFTDYLDKICALTNVPIPDTEEFRRYYEEAPLEHDHHLERRTEVNKQHLPDQNGQELPNHLHDQGRQEPEGELPVASEEPMDFPDGYDQPDA